MFEDHTALVRAPRRRRGPQRSRRSRTSAPTRCASRSTGTRSPPAERASTKPEVRRADPGPTPPTRMPIRASSPTTTCAPGDATGLPGPDDDHRRHAPVGDRGGRSTASRRPTTSPIATEFAQFAAAVAKRYSGNLPGLPAVESSRSGTSPTTATSSSPPRSRRASTASWSTRRSRRSGPTRFAERRSSWASWPRSAARPR